MPYIRSHEAVQHEVHGTRFVAYANPSTGSAQICAWRTEVAAGSPGVPHTISHEEVFHVLSGTLRFTVDDESAELTAGDVAIAPAGSRLGLVNVTDEPATVWVTTTVGLHATMADGTELAPAWAN